VLAFKAAELALLACWQGMGFMLDMAHAAYD
jgi:hypothetical protein